MRVLIACEFSGIVREAFRKRGHDAWSCDLLASEISSSQHIIGDIRDYFHFLDWNLLIGFPPCTRLTVAGARWFKGREKEQKDAVDFVLALANSRIGKIALENPIGVLSTKWRKPDQIIQPWQFGHGETKATCLWFKNLPKLVPTNIVDGRVPRVHHSSPGPDRWKERSRTLQGIADAMADQWGVSSAEEKGRS